MNVAALSLHREDTCGVFHLLAVASLVTIAVGLSPLLLGRRSLPVLATHAYCMTWSYAGLVAAGCGQLTAAVGEDVGWVVPASIFTVLAVSGVAIFWRAPSTLDRVLTERRFTSDGGHASHLHALGPIGASREARGAGC